MTVTDTDKGEIRTTFQIAVGQSILMRMPRNNTVVFSKQVHRTEVMDK